jgi:hypothetical protein
LKVIRLADRYPLLWRPSKEGRDYETDQRYSNDRAAKTDQSE